MLFKNARKFIYQNARPLDLARWQYHFEDGKRETVLNALSYYQNEDGGFAHALEADCFNPFSTPIQTWEATELLREINFTDGNHTMIKGILKYLESGKDFSSEHKQWMNTVASNNDYPHAIWWSYGENGSLYEYNPTACLAGFIIKFANPNTNLYQKACTIVKEAYSYFLERVPYEDMHITPCFIRLFEYLSEAKVDLLNMEEFKGKLKKQVQENICKDTEKWGKKYVALPSTFIESKESIFYTDNAGLVEQECQLIEDMQLADGSFPIPWQWGTDYKEFAISVNWWKSSVIIKNALYINNFCKGD